MRKLLLSSVILVFLIGFHSAAAGPAEQFAGCVTDEDEPYAARIIIEDISDTKFTVTVIGLDDFDPQIEIRHEDGRLWGCNNNRASANGIGVNLPTAVGGFTDKTAQMTVRYWADENPDQPIADFEVLVTEARRRSGQFVLIYQGAAVWDATDIDSFRVISTDEQARQRIPLYIFAVNPARPINRLNPQLVFRLGGFTQQCSTSAFSPYCEGNTLPLDGFSITLEPFTPITLSGLDSMLSFVPNLGGEEYQIEVSAYRQETWGDYVLVIQSGVGYPAESAQ